VLKKHKITTPKRTPKQLFIFGEMGNLIKKLSMLGHLWNLLGHLWNLLKHMLL